MYARFDVGEDDIAVCLPRALARHAARAIDPGRNAAVGRDHQRHARFDGAKHAARQVHVELARAPVPGVVGQVHERVGMLAAILERRHLAANHVRNRRLVANVWREAVLAVELQRGRCRRRRRCRRSAA